MDLIDAGHQLRSHLAAQPTPRAPGDLADTVRARHRQQRRQQLAMVAVGLAVVLVFGSVPVLRGLLPDTGTAGDVAAPSSAPATTLYDLPARGPVAADPAWSQAVAALPWDPSAADPDNDPPASGRRLLYAADVPGARVALVVGQEGAAFSAVWFTGPAGARPQEMTQATGTQRLLRGQPLTLLVDPPDGSTRSLVLVGFPGDTLEYVAGHTVTAAGEEVPEQFSVASEDGVAVAEFHAGRVADLQTTVRSAAGDVRSTESHGISSEPSTALLDALQDPRSLRSRVSDDALATVLHLATAHYGVGLDGATAVLLAAGPVDGGEMALVGYTFSSGATATWIGRTDVTSADGSTTGSTATSSPVPAGAPLLDQVLAVPLGDGDIALSGPREAVTAQVLDGDGTLLATLPLESGAGVGAIPPPAAQRVRFSDAAGTVLAEVPLSEMGG